MILLNYFLMSFLENDNFRFSHLSGAFMADLHTISGNLGETKVTYISDQNPPGSAP